MLRCRQTRALVVAFVLISSFNSFSALAVPRERDRSPDPEIPVIQIVKRAIKKLLPPRIVTILDDTMSVPKP